MKKIFSFFILFSFLFFYATQIPARMAYMEQGHALAGPDPTQSAGELYLNFLKTLESRFFRDLTGKEKEKILEKTKNVIQETISSLDKYGELIDNSLYESMVRETVCGIGVYIRVASRGAEIFKVVRNSPAERAGLRIGHRILAIDGQPICGLSLQKVTALLRGGRGTTVELIVIPPGEILPLVVTLVREGIKTHSDQIQGEILAPRIGFIRLKSFYTGSQAGFLALYNKLKDEGVKSLIIDLRGNLGGRVDSAFEIAGKFLSHEAPLLFVRGQKEETPVLNERPDYEEEDGESKLVILMDQNSASASEVLATALQDHKRAVIIGRQSYGKGCFQTVTPLDTGYFLKLTTHLYFSPVRHAKINGVGITPDIESVDDPETPEDEPIKRALEILFLLK